MCTTHGPGTPVIHVKYSGQALKALIDTGAGLNLLSARIAPQDMKDSEYSQIKLACQAQVNKVLGEVEVSLRIGSALFDVKCYVIEELAHDIILGSPWLVQEQALVDYRQGCLYVGGHDHPLVYWLSPQKHISKVEGPEQNECQSVELRRSPSDFKVQEKTNIGTPERRKSHPGGLRWLLDESRKSQAEKEGVKLELSTSLGARDNRENRLPKNGAIFQKIACVQKDVPYIQRIKKSIESVELNGARTVSQKKRARRFVVKEDLVWRKTIDRDGLERDRLVVPHKCVRQLICGIHGDPEKAHLGSKETFEQVAQSYYWGYMRRDVEGYVDNCEVCSVGQGSSKQTKRKKANASKPRKHDQEELSPVAFEESDKVNVSRKVTQTFANSWDGSRRVMRKKERVTEEHSVCAIESEPSMFKFSHEPDRQAIAVQGGTPALVSRIVQGEVEKTIRRTRDSKEKIGIRQSARVTLEKPGSSGAFWKMKDGVERDSLESDLDSESDFKRPPEVDRLILTDSVEKPDQVTEEAGQVLTVEQEIREPEEKVAETVVARLPPSSGSTGAPTRRKKTRHRRCPVFEKRK